MGSGQFGTPWECMHREKFSMPLHSCRTSAGVGPLPPFGSRCWQVWVAAWYWELLPATWFRVVLLNPLLLGSGKLGTPWERMHWAKASRWEVADPPAFGELPGPAGDGLPLHAAASRARAVVAMMAAAVRAVGGRARGGRRMARVLWFIMPSSAVGSWRRLVVDAQSGLAAFRNMGCSVRGGPRRRGLSGLAGSR